MDQIILPPHALYPEHQRDPISTKNLFKSNCLWENNKLILGRLVDTIAGTIQLPSHRADRFHEILHVFAPYCNNNSIRIWQKLLGEIRSMVLAIPGGLGILSTLQDALSKVSSEGLIRLTQLLHDFSADFRPLASQLDALFLISYP